MFNVTPVLNVTPSSVTVEGEVKLSFGPGVELKWGNPADTCADAMPDGSFLFGAYATAVADVTIDEGAPCSLFRVNAEEYQQGTVNVQAPFDLFQCVDYDSPMLAPIPVVTNQCIGGLGGTGGMGGAGGSTTTSGSSTGGGTGGSSNSSSSSGAGGDNGTCSSCPDCTKCSGGQCVPDSSQNGTSCGGSNVCSDGQCMTTCNNVCSSGQKQCNGNTVQTCGMVNGCYVWQDGPTCSGGEACQSGQCMTVCTNVCSNGQKQCNGNTVQTCGMINGCYAWQDGPTCSGGEVCQNGSCSASCGATTYWNPSSGSGTDSMGIQSNQTINVGITVNVQESGTGLQVQVCDGAGAFQNDVAFSIYDQATNSTVGVTISNLAAQGACSAWVTLANSTGYAQGQQFSGAWQLVSPAGSANDWGWPYGGCGVNGSPTGTCWAGSTSTLTRTCE